MIQEPLWTGLSLVGALHARVSGGMPRAVSGISIDTRTLAPGDLFFAIKGDTLDGHDFVRSAFEKGAAACVIDEAHARQLFGLGPMFVVADVQRSLQRLGAYARERRNAFVTAITGSVGKTSTKEMARLVLAQFGETHASAASYNNHWGAPLSLARTPPTARYGVYEIGMNHAGEIAALVRMVKPHIAVITRVAPAHLENFPSLDAIADAKGEIFQGVVEGGVAIINRDDETYERVAQAAAQSKAEHVLTFGEAAEAQARLLSYETVGGQQGKVTAEIMGRRISYAIGAPGKHVALNSLAVLLVAHVFDLDLEQASSALVAFTQPGGRGRRETVETAAGPLTIIDESYNANPTSMRAALELLSSTAPAPGGRRIAVLGDMLELGPRAGELHAELAPDLVRGKVDLLFTAGPHMARLYYAAPDAMRGAHRASSVELEESVLAELRPGDVLMVKGSNGSRMTRIVEAVKRKFSVAAEAAE